MSASSQIRVGSFSTLLAVGGEELSFVKAGNIVATILCCVNRSVVKGKDYFRSFTDAPVDFELTGLSEIEVLKTAFGKLAPEVGDSFVDSSNFRHRVRIATQTDITYLMFCTPTLKGK